MPVSGETRLFKGCFVFYNKVQNENTITAAKKSRKVVK